MSAAKTIAPHPTSGAGDSPRATRLKGWGPTLRRLMSEHRVSQDRLGAVLLCEQSRVSRWCDTRESETMPLPDIIELVRSDEPDVHALGVALLREVAGDCGCAVTVLPAVGCEADDIEVLAEGAREAAEGIAAFAGTLRTAGPGALLEARRQLREGIGAFVAMDRRVGVRLSELMPGPRKAR